MLPATDLPAARELDEARASLAESDRYCSSVRYGPLVTSATAEDYCQRVTEIWSSGPGGQWSPLKPAAYPAEAALHDLVQKAPQMLPLAGSPRLAVLGREVRLGTGSADLLAVESTGRLVVIEVKLAENAESRRAVVAQVLSYAGYLQGLDPEQLETQILGRHLEAGGSVLAAVQAAGHQDAVDPEDFRDGLARSLADGSFRLVIVLDSAPDELVQVVGYLQSITDKIDIDLITVAVYDVAGSQVLVPQRIEPGRRLRELSDAQVTARQVGGASHDGSAEFRADIAELPRPGGTCWRGWPTGPKQWSVTAWSGSSPTGARAASRPCCLTLSATTQGWCRSCPVRVPHT